MSRGLIVVDVQKDFCEGGSVPVAGGAQIATAIAELVEQSAAGGDYQYVVATRGHHIDPGSHFSSSPDFKDSFPVHCVAGDEGGEFHPNFAPTAAGGKVDAVFFKGAHSASKSGFEGADAEG
ncbi:isochorismatase family protein, partial [Streptomyces chryseus]